MAFVVRPDGTRIHYEVSGRRNGSPVLMIQGLGADARGWAMQRARFGRTHRVITVDNRGVGRSDVPPGPYELFEMADDALACLDDAEIDTAHVMGASMGGILAQVIGVMHPERTRSLVLACTACRHHTWRRELLTEWREQVGAHGMHALASGEGLSWLVGSRLQRRFGAFINVLARVVLQTDPKAFVAQVDAILDMSDDLRGQLHEIAVPTLVITGSQDSLTPLGDAEEIAELIPDTRLVVLSGAAHGLMAEAPNAFNDAVLRFLAECDASARNGCQGVRTSG